VIRLKEEKKKRKEVWMDWFIDIVGHDVYNDIIEDLKEEIKRKKDEYEKIKNDKDIKFVIEW